MQKLCNLPRLYAIFSFSTSPVFSLHLHFSPSSHHFAPLHHWRLYNIYPCTAHIHFMLALSPIGCKFIWQAVDLSLHDLQCLFCNLSWGVVRWLVQHRLFIDFSWNIIRPEFAQSCFQFTLTLSIMRFFSPAIAHNFFFVSYPGSLTSYSSTYLLPMHYLSWHNKTRVCSGRGLMPGVHIKRTSFLWFLTFFCRRSGKALLHPSYIFFPKCLSFPLFCAF